MQKILFVIPNLEYNGVAGQLVQLLEALPATDFQRRVCVLGRAGPWADRLRAAGVEVDTPGRGRVLDLGPLTHLRFLVRSFAPQVVHAWGRPSLRAVALSGFRRWLVASPFLGAGGRRSWLHWLDRGLLRRADRVLAFGEAEAGRCAALGVEGNRIVVVPPGIRVQPLPLPATIAGVPQAGRVVLCVGPLEMAKGHYEAVWAFDILRYAHPDLHLVLTGDGPDRPRLEHFAAVQGNAAFVHLLGRQEDIAPLYARAEVVWVPGRVESGVMTALEAMAAGRPVVATNWPRLAELVREGETGFLVPPGNKAALAARTHRLLNEPELRQALGEAGRRRAAEHFRADVLAERCARVYLE